MSQQAQLLLLIQAAQCASTSEGAQLQLHSCLQTAYSNPLTMSKGSVLLSLAAPLLQH